MHGPSVSSERETPFSLAWRASAYAKFIATNAYGSSVSSLEGNGAMITINPDQPINLLEVHAQRTKSTLGLSWDAATFTGGDIVVEHRINIAEQGGVFSVLASGLATPEYVAISLAFGTPNGS